MKFRDGPSYINMALQFCHHGNFEGYTFRTPGYPSFLIPFFDGNHVLNLKLLRQDLTGVTGAVKCHLRWLKKHPNFSKKPLIKLLCSDEKLKKNLFKKIE